MGDEFSFPPLPSLAVPDVSALNSRVRESALAEREQQLRDWELELRRERIAADLRAWKLDRREQTLKQRSAKFDLWYQECCEWHAATTAKQDRVKAHNEAEDLKREKQREELDRREAALAGKKRVHDVCAQTTPSLVAVAVQTLPSVSVAPIGAQSPDDGVIVTSFVTRTAPVGLGKDDKSDQDKDKEKSKEKEKVEVAPATSEEKARTQEKTATTERTTTPAARKKKTSKRGRDGNDDVSSVKYFPTFMLRLILA
ncbi:hypothetical protein BSKO_10877 [Bryopsis sp. KO-2023]|nr:hypothetical protein BSKO_10877 [Bryopsis sp. KO-2023]